MEHSEIPHNGRTLSCEVGEQSETVSLAQNMMSFFFCLIENILASSSKSSLHHCLNLQSAHLSKWDVSQV